MYPACLECNKILGAFPSSDYYERLLHVSRKIERKLLKIEPWTDRELSEMGHTMKSYIMTRCADLVRLQANFAESNKRFLT